MVKVLVSLKFSQVKEKLYSVYFKYVYYNNIVIIYSLSDFRQR